MVTLNKIKNKTNKNNKKKKKNENNMNLSPSLAYIMKVKVQATAALPLKKRMEGRQTQACFRSLEITLHIQFESVKRYVLYPFILLINVYFLLHII